MAHNEKFEELAALHALGLPLGEDEAAFARHRQEGCAVCEELLLDFEISASALAAGVPARAPRPALKARILEALPGSPPARVVAMPRRPSGAGWWLAAAAALLFVFAVWDDARLRREREDLRSRAAQLSAELSTARQEMARRDLRVIPFTRHVPLSRAKVFWSEKAKTGMLLASNLAALPPDKQYELWVFAEGKPVAAGVFDADPSGRALFESRSLSGLQPAQNFAVTVEPRGGVPQPTGPIVLVGSPAA